MKINVPESTPAPVTHEGGTASRLTPEQQLRRTLMTCLLWETTFYESGVSVADRLKALIPLVAPEKVAALAVQARTQMKLRHAPLLVVREMARLPEHKKWVKQTLQTVIQRPDELGEFLALYWADNDGKKTLSKQVQRGLGLAFRKFDEYSLAKYNRDAKVKLRDVLFLSHAKPIDAQGMTKVERKELRDQGDTLVHVAETGVAETVTTVVRPLHPQEELFRKLAENQLATPDTWEVALSGGADKKETFTRLMQENKLGVLAFLRNLRNMAEAGVDESVVRDYAAEVKVERALPFRFIAAARYVPQWEPLIESAMLRCLATQEKLPGRTFLLIDVSGSMEYKLSGKSELLRLDAACGLAILLREIAETVTVGTFSNYFAVVPPRHGFALRDAINVSQSHGGTLLGAAVEALHAAHDYDRLIVITDEQIADHLPPPRGRGYVINVGSYQNGVGYGKYVHCDGFSESIIDFIRAYEAEVQQEQPS